MAGVATATGARAAGDERRARRADRALRPGEPQLGLCPHPRRAAQARCPRRRDRAPGQQLRHPGRPELGRRLGRGMPPDEVPYPGPRHKVHRQRSSASTSATTTSSVLLAASASTGRPVGPPQTNRQGSRCVGATCLAGASTSTYRSLHSLNAAATENTSSSCGQVPAQKRCPASRHALECLSGTRWPRLMSHPHASRSACPRDHRSSATQTQIEFWRPSPHRRRRIGSRRGAAVKPYVPATNRSATRLGHLFRTRRG